MNDLSRIVDEMCAWLDGVEPASAPTIPTLGDQRGNGQAIDIQRTSYTSRTSHAKNEPPGLSDLMAVETSCFSAEGSRVTSSYVADVGSAGSGAKTPAGSTPFPFPQDLKNVGSVGRESGFCGPTFPDLNRVAPPPGDPLPISPADVHAGVARELRALAEDGCDGPDALQDAVEIVRAKIRNSEALAERQGNPGLCHACGEPLDGSRPEVAVLNPRGSALHLHGGECHDTHSRRRAALVSRIMAAAGYGAEATGEAA